MSSRDKEEVKKILEDIKEVITGDKKSDDFTKVSDYSESDEEVLELNEIVKEDGSTEIITPPLTANEAISKADETISKTNELTSKANELTSESSQAIAETIAAASLNDKSAVENNTVKPLTPSNIAASDGASLAAHGSNGANDKSLSPNAFISGDIIASPEPSKKDSLISDDSAKLSAQPIKDLTKLLHKNSQDNISFSPNITLEELVIEALKPQLSAWLDKNLPNLVKSIVEKEIKRLIPEE